MASGTTKSSFRCSSTDFAQGYGPSALILLNFSGKSARVQAVEVNATISGNRAIVDGAYIALEPFGFMMLDIEPKLGA